MTEISRHGTVVLPGGQRIIPDREQRRQARQEAHRIKVESRLAARAVANTPPPRQYDHAATLIAPGVKLRKSLIFHCFPKSSVDWRANVMDTFRYVDIFDGRILVSATYGPGCASEQEILDFFKQFGDRVELTLAGNVPKDGINTTFLDQIKAIRAESGIILKSHTKGISHATPTEDRYGHWRRNMTTFCCNDLGLVDRAFANGYRTFGVFKSTTADGERVVNHLEKRWSGWHYPGAIFWFDPRYIPEWFYASTQHHYVNEEFPCILGPSDFGYCRTAPNVDYKAPLDGTV